MVDWAIWAPTIVALFVAFISYIQQNRVIQQQSEEIKHQAKQLEEQRLGRRREYIEKFYPSIAENLRHTIKDFDTNYKGLQGQYDEFFDVLIEMRDDSTLKIIESLDSGLYEKCSEILDTYLPMLDDLHSQRDDTWHNIESLWTSWVSLNFNLLPPMNVTSEQFTKSLVISSLWNYWRKEDELAQARLSEACERVFSSEGDTNEVRMMLFEAFKSICENEWLSIREQYTKIYSSLGNLITSIILPRIEDTIKRLT